MTGWWAELVEIRSLGSGLKPYPFIVRADCREEALRKIREEVSLYPDDLLRLYEPRKPIIGPCRDIKEASDGAKKSVESPVY